VTSTDAVLGTYNLTDARLARDLYGCRGVRRAVTPVTCMSLCSMRAGSFSCACLLARQGADALPDGSEHT
ncbi:hypothetical protein B7755_052025, partial [Streptomyces sp. NBS 14/10]|uniref:hypothetical protein n=1 Tax=Streptomyces sp. NBS 14/10 TaxID=1945643 RepID=UPI000B9D29A4